MPPRRVLRHSQTPFLIMYLEEEEEEGVEEDMETKEEEPKRRYKRYVEISADLNSFPNHLTHPGHEDKKMASKNKYKKHETETDGDLDLPIDYENDDLTDSETDKHQLNTDGKTLPYPRWWGKKKHRRRRRMKLKKEKRRGKRRNERENETVRKKQKWNILPNIWKTFGKEVILHLNYNLV